MKKLFVLGFILLNLLTPNMVMAQTSSGSGSVNVNATVGAGITISLSGFASPNASVVATANGSFLASTTADATGVFSISNIPIALGNTNICFTTVDFKKIGESLGCIDTGNISATTSIDGIVLPPTIGLLKKQITAGQETTVFGYGMPNSSVTINIDNGQTVTLTTDATGYYQYKYQAVAAGKFTFKSKGVYNNKQSLDPKTGVTLEALSKLEGLKNSAQKTFSLLQPILFLILILILVGIIGFLIFIITRKKHKKREKSAMHHDWLLEIEEKEENKD